MSTPYLDWKPALTPEQVFEKRVTLGEVRCEGKDVYWLETGDDGRTAIVRYRKGKREIISKGLSVRSRVHEYGGGAYAVKNGVVYAVNDDDKRIYRIEDGKEPERITQEARASYAALFAADDLLLFVMEREAKPENENLIAAIDLTKPCPQEPIVVVQGEDFYSTPVATHDRLAWMQWSHPNMPWDESSLVLAEREHADISDAKIIARGPGLSVAQPRFDQLDRLVFVMDQANADPSSAKNWWNLYWYDGKIAAITALNTELAEPHWVFGQSSSVTLDDDTIIAAAKHRGRQSLLRVKTDNTVEEIVSSYTSVASMATDGKTVYLIAAGPVQPPAVLRLDPKSGRIENIKASQDILLDKEAVSVPQVLRIGTQDGEHCYAFFYEPRNPAYEPEEKEKPPLIVMAHGGPTSAAKVYFRPEIQYWTSAGFAVLDVDYRGSTGYGKKYRDALYGEWGVLDVRDVADAIAQVLKEGKADPRRVVIRGGSAGGYLVQRMLTRYPEICCAGASYYGIGDLSLLIHDTHKFESRYTKRLLSTDGRPQAHLMQERSPLHHLDKLKAPMVLFQGMEDKIVPPSLTRQVADALKARGIPHASYEYPDEGHGFRRKGNKVDALAKEHAFYRAALSGTLK